MQHNGYAAVQHNRYAASRPIYLPDRCIRSDGYPRMAGFADPANAPYDRSRLVIARQTGHSSICSDGRSPPISWCHLRLPTDPEWQNTSIICLFASKGRGGQSSAPKI
jgi:hypothetical protein